MGGAAAAGTGRGPDVDPDQEAATVSVPLSAGREMLRWGRASQRSGNQDWGPAV